MALQPGARLGPYEILSPLGAGGMGEVYRARDTRLGREVAVKVLPSALASTPERLARFEREARSASALNHPNIVTIYEFGSSGSASFIAMELVQGESLRASILEGPLPVRRLLEIAVQIAEGLAKAHASGIVHRDLKPENVMLTPEGHVKILDFGLAKLTQADSSGGESPEGAVSVATQEGVIVGSVDYMSPEQAMGAAIDHRSDQFSLGSILYEMATGHWPFRRASAPQTMTAIIQDEPEPIAALNPRIPAPLRWTVQRCLAKEPRNRYASTEDLAGELRTIRDNLSEASQPAGRTPAGAAPSSRSWIVAAVAATILLAAAIAAWGLRPRESVWKNPLAGARFQRLTDWEGSELDAEISRDGKFVAFVSDQAGPFDAWLAQVGNNEVLNLSRGQIPVTGGDRRRNVGFTGDDSHVWVGISPGSAGNLSDVWLVPAIGGRARPFLPGAVSIAWSSDGSRLVYNTADPAQPLFVADRNGADSKEILRGEVGIRNHYPVWSPDGRFIYFARGIITTNDMDIWRIPSNGGRLERLTNHHARVGYPAFLDERTLVYTASRPDGSGSGLYVLDLDRRVPHAASFGLEEYLSISASADGKRLAATVANPTSHLWTAPITDHMVGEPEVRRLSLPALKAAAPRFGAGQLLFLSSKGGANGLWMFKDGTATELWRGTAGGVIAAPAITRDGKQICFVVQQEGKGRLFVMTADGTGTRRIAESLDVRDAPSWSPDGAWIAVVAPEAKEQPLFKVPAGGGAPVRLLGGINNSPLWSPDGRFILSCQQQVGPYCRAKATTPQGNEFALPEISVPFGGDRYRFLPDGKSVVTMRSSSRGEDWDFWKLDLFPLRMRQLTNLRAHFDTRRFDVSTDGRQIVFDRFRDNSDVVLIDRSP